MIKFIFTNLYAILILATVLIRSIIALPLTFAAVKHFQFFDIENNWLAYLIAYISILCVEIVMTLFSFLTSSFKHSGLVVGYYASLSFVGIFFLLNAALIWNIQYVYPGVSWVSIAILEILNAASVALSESIGYMHNDIPRNTEQYNEVVKPISTAAVAIKNDSELALVDKVKQLWALGEFQTQMQLANFLVIKQATVSAYLKR